MESENTAGSEPGPQPQPSIIASAIARAKADIGRAQSNSNTARMIADAGLLGACLLFFAAMLGVKDLDHNLMVAIVAFASAIPFLVYGYMFGSLKFPDDAAPLLSMAQAAWFIESLGYVGVAVGVVFILAHFSGSAVIAVIAATVFCAVMLLVGGGAIITIPVWRKARKEGLGQKESSSPSEAASS